VVRFGVWPGPGYRCGRRSRVRGRRRTGARCPVSEPRRGTAAGPPPMGCLGGVHRSPRRPGPPPYAGAREWVQSRRRARVRNRRQARRYERARARIRPRLRAQESVRILPPGRGRARGPAVGRRRPPPHEGRRRRPPRRTASPRPTRPPCAGCAPGWRPPGRARGRTRTGVRRAGEAPGLGSFGTWDGRIRRIPDRSSVQTCPPGRKTAPDPGRPSEFRPCERRSHYS
jgi:hypothetical protein